jgi:hypothetical protein
VGRRGERWEGEEEEVGSKEESFLQRMGFFKEKKESFSDGVYGSLTFVHLKMRPNG